MRSLLVVLGAALLLAGPAAAAETPLVDALTGQAREDYKSAVLLYSDGDYAGAVVKFRTAHERSGEPRLLWNIAACEKNLRHYGNVLKLVERYRRETAGRLSDERRRETEALIEAVRALVSTVHVVVDEPGATIFVDDVPAGTTPLAEPLLLDLGQRRLRIAKAGFKDHTIVQDFAGGSQTTLSVTLERAPRVGRLSIDTGDSRGTISLDGTVVGEGRWEGTVPSGPHQVRVAAAGMRTRSTALELHDGETQSLSLALEPEKKAGLSPLIWVGGGLLLAAGLGAGAYLLFRPEQAASPTVGTLSPGTVQLPLRMNF